METKYFINWFESITVNRSTNKYPQNTSIKCKLAAYHYNLSNGWTVFICDLNINPTSEQKLAFWM